MHIFLIVELLERDINDCIVAQLYVDRELVVHGRVDTVHAYLANLVQDDDTVAEEYHYANGIWLSNPMTGKAWKELYHSFYN